MPSIVMIHNTTASTDGVFEEELRKNVRSNILFVEEIPSSPQFSNFLAATDLSRKSTIDCDEVHTFTLPMHTCIYLTPTKNQIFISNMMNQAK